VSRGRSVRRTRHAGRRAPKRRGPSARRRGGGRARSRLLLFGAAAVLASLVAVRFARDGGATTTTTAPALSAPAERVRVEILNAGGLDGVARAATARLREAGFDVVHFGNADAFDRDSSVVVDRVGRLELARAVADGLGIGNVLSQPDSNLYVEVSVLLGRDWSAIPPPTSGEVSSGDPWWDARRWIGR